jgi:hypothetical protein
LRDLAAAEGIQIAPSKCHLLPPLNNFQLSAEFFQRAENAGLGIVNSAQPFLHLLGADLHRDESAAEGITALRNRISEDVEARHLHFFERLQHPLMPNQIALRLLRLCGVPRLSFITRVMPSIITARVAHEFDERVRECFMGISSSIRPADIANREHLSKIIHAPLNQGGFGLTAH